MASRYVTNEHFIRVWQSSATALDVATRLGLNGSGARLASARRRARKRKTYIEDVPLAFLMVRHRSRCWLCGERVDPDGPYVLRPSIDHATPLSRGGKHSKANCRLAHRRCNSRKGAKLPLVAVMELR